MGALKMHDLKMTDHTDWLIDYVPLDTKQVISETFPKIVSWLGMEKQNLARQKHAFTNQNK